MARRMAVTKCASVIAACLAFVMQAARGQEQIYKWWGDQTNESFGGHVSASADLTGDGIPDILVGAGGASTDHGFIRAFSGSDGSTLWTLSGNSGEYLGFATLPLGDVDQDGFVDFLATSANPPLGNPNGYGVTLYSGATRSPIYTILGDASEGLGASLVPLGDLDLDGFDDFAASEGDIVQKGIHVFSGKAGTLLYLIPPPSDSSPTFGHACAGGGDVDGDGFNDLVIGDYFAVPGGKVLGAAWVHSAKSGTLLYELIGVGQTSEFGYSVALIHDVDQDGLADVAVGAPLEHSGTQDSGHVHVYSGKFGSPLLDVSVPRYDHFGIALGQFVADAGDVNHDGYGDFFALQPWGGEFYSQYSNDAVVRLYSGRDGGQIYHYYDPQDPYFGVGPGMTTLMPDLDGDGNPEVVFGSWNDDDGSLTHPGSASVWRTDDLYVDVTPRQASIYDTIDVTIGQGLAGAPFVLFLVAVNGIPTTTLVGAGLFDSTGRAELTGIVPPGVVGYDFGLKAFALDARPKVIDSGVETLSIR